MMFIFLFFYFLFGAHILSKKQFNEERDPARRKEILVELGRISKELKNG